MITPFSIDPLLRTQNDITPNFSPKPFGYRFCKIKREQNQAQKHTQSYLQTCPNFPRDFILPHCPQGKRNTDLQNLPVIIFSTASDVETVKNIFRNAAHYYICKPPDFSQLKKVIYEALTLIMQKNNPLPLQEKFMITGDSIIIPNKK